MKITINILEWAAYFVVIMMALWAADITLTLVKKWYEWRVRKKKTKIEEDEIKENLGKSIAEAYNKGYADGRAAEREDNN